LDPALKNNLNEQIEYLRTRNSGIKSLEYFYEVYKEVYGNRAKELLNHKSMGKKIVGVFCNFVPLELILAADAIPIKLASGFQDPIILAEEILPRNFCPLIKSSYGISLMNSSHFDLVDLIIIPTTCDGKKKLGEILSEHKPTWVIEVPHTNETPQARQLWFSEIELLKKQLERLTGNKITVKKLKNAIELLNRKRAVTRRLYEIRKRTPPPIWGRDAMMVTNLSIYDDVKRWTERTEALCDELNNHKPVCDISLPRIMITGSPTMFPTWKIPTLIEESGGVIVMDDICTGSKELWDPIESAYWTMNDMLIAIADKYLMNTCACFTPNLVRADRVVQFVEDFKVNGVLYHVLQACHIYGMEELRIQKALDKINIPVLSIETDFSQEDVEQIRTRLEAFLEMISLRKSSGDTTSSPTKPAEGLIRQLETPQAQAAFTSTSTVAASTPSTPSTPLTSTSTSQTASTPASPAPVADPTSPPIANDPIPKVNDPTVASVPADPTSTPQAFDPTQKVVDPTPMAADSTPQVADPTPKPKVADPTPTPKAIDPTPKAVEPTPQTTVQTPQAADPTLYKADLSSINVESKPVKKEDQNDNKDKEV
jgi:benzoyl-CoA reductase/2-hydroxyglutaryl-CoA dehydratase subunit BcrC/BadD/HgdB